MSAIAKTPELVSPSTSAPPDPSQWGPMLDLDCELALELPIPRFTIADLLRLEPQAVLETDWTQGEDVPVKVNSELVAWAEFEVVDGRLAMRVTEWT